MDTVQIKAGSNVILEVSLSTEAVVYSVVWLNEKKIKGTKQNKFKVDIGLIDDIDGSELIFTGAFNVLVGDFGTIYNNTIVKNRIKFTNDEKTFNGIKTKVTDKSFIATNVIKLLKI